MNKAIAFIRLARPHHYIKNGLVLVPVFFAHRLTDPNALFPAVAGFVGFCLAASAVYVFNDIVDAKADASHPLREDRPLAAGVITNREARLFLMMFLGLTLVGCLWLGSAVYCLVLLGYIILNGLYSLKFKKIPVVDVFCLAAGFLLRIFAGAAVIRVPVSPWLAGLTLSLALFLGFAKRRCDMDICEPAGGNQVAAGYHRGLLTVLIIGLALITAVGYTLYTISPAVIREHATSRLYWTIPWVVLGMVRYLWIVFVRQSWCYPVTALLRDHWLQLTVLGWIVTLWLMIY